MVAKTKTKTNEVALGRPKSIPPVPVLADARERFRGCLLGLAAGDAVGATNEFATPGSFVEVRDLVGGGPFHLEPGQWTDDTSCALCLATSLTENHAFVASDCMRRMLDWWQHGTLSSTGRCFDIGSTTSAALSRFARDGDPFQGRHDGQSNGCIMRLAPVPLFYAKNAVVAIEMASHAARLTHGGAEAVDCARYLAGLIVGAVRGVPKGELLADGRPFVPSGASPWGANGLTKHVLAIASGSYRDRPPVAGYSAVACLHAALWAFDRGEDFASTILFAANLGDDSDTVAAVAGQIAGAYYGESGIPETWRKKLTWGDRIASLADSLFDESDLSGRKPSALATGKRADAARRLAGSEVLSTRSRTR